MLWKHKYKVRFHEKQFLENHSHGSLRAQWSPLRILQMGSLSGMVANFLHDFFVPPILGFCLELGGLSYFSLSILACHLSSQAQIAPGHVSGNTFNEN